MLGKIHSQQQANLPATSQNQGIIRARGLIETGLAKSSPEELPARARTRRPSLVRLLDEGEFVPCARGTPWKVCFRITPPVVMRRPRWPSGVIGDSGGRSLLLVERLGRYDRQLQLALLRSCCGPGKRVVSNQSLKDGVLDIAPPEVHHPRQTSRSRWMPVV